MALVCTEITEWIEEEIPKPIADPHETVIGQLPSVVRIPAFHGGTTSQEQPCGVS